MTPETLNRLHEALTEPIALFNSATEENSYVAMLEIKSSKSATVILPVEINAIGPYESEINIVRSAYAKADSVTGFRRTIGLPSSLERGICSMWIKKN